MQTQPQKKFNLKFQSKSKTKRVRDLPETYEQLKKVVQNIIKDESNNQDVVIQYFDKDNELINVSDDEDLLTAYDIASNDMEGNLKFVIGTKEVDIEKDSKIEKKSKDKKKKDKKEKKEKKEKKKIRKKKKDALVKEEQKAQLNTSEPIIIDTSSCKERANTFDQPQMDLEFNHEDDLKSDSEEEPIQEKHRRCHKGSGLPPRKALKKLICRELDMIAPQIFQSLMACRELGQPIHAQTQINQQKSDIVTHQSVACDGCGITPITGVRYKCCVCKNFDYCEVCEERLGHEHPFIKILRPENAPETIITGISDEKEQKEQMPREQQQRDFCHGFRGGVPSWCGRGGRFRGMFKHFMDIANTYAGQFQDEDSKEENKDQNEQAYQGFCHKRQKWGEKRAVILKKPEQVLIGEAGKVIFAEIEVQNQTKWPWKRGCYIGESRGVDECVESKQLKVKDFTIDMEVKGMQTIKLSVPIFIPEDFNLSQIIQIPLSFYGPKHTTFGQPFSIQVQVQEGQAELDILKAAITLAEAGMGSYDECVEALKQCRGDENAALLMLIDKKEK